MTNSVTLATLKVGDKFKYAFDSANTCPCTFRVLELGVPRDLPVRTDDHQDIYVRVECLVGFTSCTFGDFTGRVQTWINHCKVWPDAMDQAMKRVEE